VHHQGLNVRLEIPVIQRSRTLDIFKARQRAALAAAAGDGK
jgi:hypothetical protein